MRKVLCVLACAAFAGCASLSNPKSLSTLSRVGVVAVSANAEIGWYGEEKSVSLLGAATNLAANEGTKAGADAAALLERSDVLIDQAEAILLETLSAATRVKLASREEVTGSSAYAAAKEKPATGVVILKPLAYKFVDQKDTVFATALAAEVGVDASIYAYFGLDKMMMSGVGKNGVLAAQVSLSISVIDASGKLIFTKAYAQTGKERIPVVADIYDAKKLHEAFLGVIRGVCEQLATDLDG